MKPASLPALLLGGWIAAGAAVGGHCQTDVLYVEGEITSFLARDMDLDGLDEIWASYHQGGQRFLGLFHGEPGRGAGVVYGRQPDRVIPVDAEAIFYCVGTFEHDSRLDLVLVSRKSGVLYPTAPSAEAEQVRRLFTTQLFFTMPSRTELPAWMSAAKLDIDGDGLDDLCLPEKRRLRMLLQERRPGEAEPPIPAPDLAKEPGGIPGPGAAREGGKPAPAAAATQAPWGREAALPVGYYVLTDAREEKMREVFLDFAKEYRGVEPILDITGAYPFPMLADFDGDRKLDWIVKQPGHRLQVYLQREPAVFGDAPSVEIAVPWAKEAASLSLVDLNGDGRLDMVATRLLLKDLATEVRVFIADATADGQGFKAPRQEIRVQGFFRRPELADADGDRRLDLLVSTYRVDLLAQLKQKVVEELEITHEVILGGTEQPFERRPAFQRTFSLRTRALEDGPPRPHLYAGRDMTGDGRTDILFLEAGQSLRLFRGLPGKPLRYEEDVGFAEKVEDPLEVALRNLDGGSGDEIILRYPHRLEVRRGKP